MAGENFEINISPHNIKITNHQIQNQSPPIATFATNDNTSYPYADIIPSAPPVKN